VINHHHKKNENELVWEQQFSFISVTTGLYKFQTIEESLPTDAGSHVFARDFTSTECKGTTAFSPRSMRVRAHTH